MIVLIKLSLNNWVVKFFMVRKNKQNLKWQSNLQNTNFFWILEQMPRLAYIMVIFPLLS